MLNVERMDRIAIYTLDRPKALNAVCRELAERLVSEMKLSERDHGVRVHLVRSNGKHFSAGADIKEMTGKTSENIGESLKLDIWKSLRQMRYPIVAQVQGFALGGGCELALSADFIYASDEAVFGQPEINLGLMPGAGGTVRWVKLVGRIRAAEILILGERIPATKALEWGLINKVIPEEQLGAETLALCARLAKLPSDAVYAIKSIMNKNLETPELEAMDMERNLFYGLFGTKDQIEGVNAFVEKRAPKFQ